MSHQGSCLCGQVRYQVEIDPSQGTRCNCTYCTKIGITGGRVKPADFRFLQGEEQLSRYGNLIERLFCKHCGIHLVARGDIPELGGAFVSVNLNTLDDIDPGLVKVGYFDGRHDNWHAGMRSEPWPIF